MSFDPQDIGKQPVGTAAFWPMTLDGMRKMAWVIRMSSADINVLKGKSVGKQKAKVVGQLIGDKTVVLFSVSVALGAETPDESRTYQADLNEHATGFGGSLETLTTQDLIPVLLIGDSGKLEHSLALPNEIRPFAQKALGRVSEVPAWTADEFAQLANQLAGESSRESPMYSRRQLIESIVKLRIRDWKMHHKRRGQPVPVSDAELEAATATVVERFTTGIFAAQSSDPTSDFVLAMIEGEIEVQLLAEYVIVALACCRHAGLAPKDAAIAVQFTTSDGGESSAGLQVVEIMQSFAFAKVFAFGTMEHVRVSEEGESLLRIFAQEKGSPEARYGFTRDSGMSPPTDTLPEGWRLT